jgi:hypothetical protein
MKSQREKARSSETDKDTHVHIQTFPNVRGAGNIHRKQRGDQPLFKLNQIKIIQNENSLEIIRHKRIFKKQHHTALKIVHKTREMSGR